MALNGVCVRFQPSLPKVSLSELTVSLHKPYTNLRQTPYANILEMDFVWVVENNV
jgi:hypothetical protein